MVAIQINQSSQIAKADIQSRSYELAMQFNIARMGENPNAVFAKAATHPDDLNDEELLVLSNAAYFWINYDSHTATMVALGMAESEEVDRRVWRERAHDIWSSSRVLAALWQRFRENQNYAALQERESWADVIDAEFRSASDRDGDAQLITYLRAKIAED